MHNYFDRGAVKARAKTMLKKCYWLAVAVSAIVSLIMGNLSLPNLSVDFPISTTETEGFQAQVPFSEGPFLPGTAKLMPILVVFIVLLALIVVAAVIAVTFVKAYFLDGVIHTGHGKFYLGVTRGEAKFKDVFFGVGGQYRNIRKVLFARFWRLALWELFVLIPAFALVLGVVILRDGGVVLGTVGIAMSIMGFVPAMIPAIIKNYEYSMIPYLVAEYPEMTVAEAFAATRELTDGYKGALFALDLSFLGWQILAALSFGVGFVFLQPYIDASHAEAYAQLCRLRCPPAPFDRADVSVNVDPVYEAPAHPLPPSAPAVPTAPSLRENGAEKKEGPLCAPEQTAAEQPTIQSDGGTENEENC